MLKSMTGFARVDSSGSWGSAVWEIRSVNHRYLDLSFKLPEALRSIETKIREQLSKRFSRGKIECSLRFHAAANSETALQLNQGMVDAILGTEKQIIQHTERHGELSIYELLRWPGVVTTLEADVSHAVEPVIDILLKGLDALESHRANEGEKLVQVIQSKLEGIQQQVAIAQTTSQTSLQQAEDKIKDRFASLEMDLDTQRFEQELAILLQKMDVTEELDRLRLHHDEVSRIISKPGVVGRRLDFLMQELNREANTLASKSCDVRLTNAAVELKVLIEQIREQVQNIE